MELIYTDADHVRQGVIREFELDLAYGDDENDFELVTPMPRSRTMGHDSPAVVDTIEGEGFVEIEGANGSQLRGLEVDGLARLVTSRNLLDPSGIAGSYINTSGAIATGASSATLHTVRVEPGAKYTYSGRWGRTDSASVTVRFENASGGMVGYTSLGTINSDWIKTFTVPDGAAFAKFATFVGNTECQLELGVVAHTYVPYVRTVEVVEGKNLFNANAFTNTGTYMSVKLPDGGGVISVTPKAGVVIPAGLYAGLTETGNSSDANVYWQVANGVFQAAREHTVVSGTYKYFSVYPKTYGNASILDYFDIQLERGPVATPYEPYGGVPAVVAGKNLLDASALKPGFIVPSSGAVAASELFDSSDFIDVYGSKNLTVTNAPRGTGAGYAFYGASGYISGGTYPGSGLIGVNSVTVPSGARYFRTSLRVSDVGGAQLERGATATPYEPYRRESASVQLPHDHAFLASLPDGTRDELTVDADGRAVMVQRVGRYVIDGSEYWTKSGSYPGGWYSQDVITRTGIANYSKNYFTDKYVVARNTSEYKAGTTYIDNSFSVRPSENSSQFSDASAFKTWLASNKITMYYQLATPRTVDLGTVELPRTMDGYTRVTVESTIAAPMSIGYEAVPESHSYSVVDVPSIDVGALVYEYGSEVGGVVDSVGFDSTGGAPVMKYSGRTWHGMMDASVTRPDGGQAYLTLNGDINAAIGTLLSRSQLSSTMGASPTAAGVHVTWQVPRYITVWEAVRRLCRAYGMRPKVGRRDGKTVVEAVPMGRFDNGTVSDAFMELRFTRHHRPVNHLVLLGRGELEDRIVADFYADADGNVDVPQHFFGADEVTAVYENTSEDDWDELMEACRKKLREYQELADVRMTLPPSMDFAVGDEVTAMSTETGISASAEITKKVVRVGDAGEPETDYSLGEPTINRYR